MTKIMRNLKRKSQGSLHILLISLFLILFVVLVTMLAYNNYSLSLMDSYADDALTDALLAAGTVNVEEYGQSGQVLLSDTLRARRSDSNSSGGQSTYFDTQTEIQNAYEQQKTQNPSLIKYLTDENGFIKWTYPEYRTAKCDDVYGSSYGDNVWVFATNYGYDIQKQEEENPYVGKSDQNYNKINYMTLENNTLGGEYVYSWIDSTQLDNAFLKFVKELNNDNSSLGTGQSVDANNKELAKAYENFLTTFGWDFGLTEVTKGGSVNAMAFNNFKYHGGKLGSLTHIASQTGAYDSPIYIDYITVFNVYKHYLTDEYGRFITYPDKTKDGSGYYIKVGENIYSLDAGDSNVVALYEKAKENGLNGLPIYDKMIITKTTLSRGSDTGDTCTVDRSYNMMSQNHSESSEPIIQSVDYLDPSVFIFSDFGTEQGEYNGTAQLNQQYSSYIQQLLNSTVTVFGSDTSDNTLPTIGVIQTSGASYPWSQNYQDSTVQNYLSRPSAKNYPNRQAKTYQLTWNPQNPDMANNKQNILLFNQAVMGQIEFDVQVMGQDGSVTGSDSGINTAFYSRIVDITIQADQNAPEQVM